MAHQWLIRPPSWPTLPTVRVPGTRRTAEGEYVPVTEDEWMRLRGKGVNGDNWVPGSDG